MVIKLIISADWRSRSPSETRNPCDSFCFVTIARAHHHSQVARQHIECRRRGKALKQTGFMYISSRPAGQPCLVSLSRGGPNLWLRMRLSRYFRRPVAAQETFLPDRVSPTAVFQFCFAGWWKRGRLVKQAMELSQEDFSPRPGRNIFQKWPDPGLCSLPSFPFCRLVDAVVSHRSKPAHLVLSSYWGKV